MATTTQVRSTPERIAAFIAELSVTDIPDEALRLAERCFVDTIGVTLAGSVEGAGEIAATSSVSMGSGEGPAKILGHEAHASIADAAFVNGTAGHGLDFDDVSPGMSGHPSVTMVPAILAATSILDSSGRDLLTAFIAGFETQCYLAKPMIPNHYEAGWHATATIGTFGSAAATAKLLDLSTEQTQHALNIAASMPAGLKRNFGSTTKPIHAGQAARSGVTAAFLASEGATADPNAITESRGFYELYDGPTGGVDEPFRLGEQWAILEDGVHVKKYPCCYFTHTGITAASRLVEEHDITPESVESVSVIASQGAEDALHHEDPQTGLEGKFSMHYTVASAIVRDRVGLEAFADENVLDPDVQSVREVVSMSVDDSLPYGSHRTTVTIDTSAGDSHTLTLEEPPGTHQDPLTNEELREKYVMCATQVYDEARATTQYETLDGLRSEQEVHSLIDML